VQERGGGGGRGQEGGGEREVSIEIDSQESFMKENSLKTCDHGHDNVKSETSDCGLIPWHAKATGGEGAWAEGREAERLSSVWEVMSCSEALML
jgi:hypothetical protein